MSSVTVVIPTYNERDNLEPLVKRVFEQKVPYLKMVVVDDNSPDGTGELAERLAKIYPLRVIHRRQKQGLGRAYAEAFSQILGSAEKPDCIIQMDADLSHDPALIPIFLSSIRKCDLVLGSRYVVGGKIENWNLGRRLISRLGNLYARLVLNLPYRDLTGGYKCWRYGALEALDLNSLSSNGYNFQIETTYKAHKNGFYICEIPITFTERKIGRSKFNLGIMAESFIKVFWLKFRG